MDTITVDKPRLIAVLRTNRDEHEAMYLKAIERYRERTLVWLNEQIDALKAGKDAQRSCPLPIPERHTEDFDRAIEMLEWDQGSTVDLAEHDFRQYIQNKWGWAQTFTSNTASYVQ